MSLLRRSSLRYLLGHPGQLVLMVVGVALGVGVVVSIRLAVESAREAFRISTRTVAGRATHHVVGGPAGVPDSVFDLVRLDLGVRTSAPVVEGWVSTPRLPGRALRLLGVDPFSELSVRPWLAGGGPEADVSALMTVPGAVILSRATATGAGLEPGDTLRLSVDGRPQRAVLVGLLDGTEGRGGQGVRNLVVADVGRAQELMDAEGRLSRIDLVIPEARDELLARVRDVLPPGLRLEETGTRTRTMSGMIRAFDLNLTALSLLALLFGMFLVYNAVTFSVVQRRELLGTLRALGSTRREVFGLVLGEAVVVGAVGSLAGVGLGVVLGRTLVRLVTRTINDLYFVISVEGVSLAPGVLVLGVVSGIVATVASALAPAREAARAPPRAALTRSVIEERWRRSVPRAAWAGLGLLGVGGLVLMLSEGVVASFGALFAVVLGLALLTPAATVALMAAARPALDRVVGILGTLAARGVVSALSRTAPAVAALMVAVSVTVGLGVMISSFRGTLTRWLERTLQADVYVAPPSPVASRAEGRLEPALAERLARVEGVVGRNTYRNTFLATRYGEVRLTALDLDPRGESAFDFVEGEPERAVETFRRGEGLLVSEPFANRNGVGVGDTVVLPTGEGERRFSVAGVYTDYGSDRGVLMMARSTYDRLFDDPAVTSLGLFLDDEADPAAVLARLGEAAGRTAGEAPPAEPQAVVIRSNRELREASLRVFDRTFAITAVLRALAFLVAFIGVLAALMALQLERGRELGVLRANGLTPGQVWTLVTTQTGLMGAAAGLLALPAGLVLAAVMIFVVNKRSFGWTLRMEVGPEVLLQAVGLALVGALLAGVYPAWKMARTPPSEAVRAE